MLSSQRIFVGAFQVVFYIEKAVQQVLIEIYLKITVLSFKKMLTKNLQLSYFPGTNGFKYAKNHSFLQKSDPKKV